MDVAVVLGSAAGLCSTISFAPQAFKIIRRRDTHSLSAGMYALTVTGFALWVSYGIALRQWPLILANGICLAVSTFILVMILLPSRQKNEVADAVDPTK
ncbi:SemiSWEET family sugar transporter [Chelatococcus reniformis]|uniref:Glutathione synthetase n=1 Tax=Chelatococcus reniformis TaxID=1494448 RepID=A0A916UQT4_9HYPH|nr:SemiSWEET transporter [Chelatococcus reniformis]GGC83746.1 hypothetical protein GCM10010994_47050 [Chelatococcus reniformis]